MTALMRMFVVVVAAGLAFGSPTPTQAAPPDPNDGKSRCEHPEGVGPGQWDPARYLLFQ